MRRKRKRQLVRLLMSLILLITFGVGAYWVLRPAVVEIVVIEAGDPMVDLHAFLINPKEKAEYVSDIASVNTSVPGLYKIDIKVRFRTHTTVLQVLDTIAPYGEASDIIALKGDVLTPDHFLTELEDVTAVSKTLIGDVDTSVPGKYQVEILLEDTSSNQTVLKPYVTVLDVKHSISVEAGSILSIQPQDFVEGGDYEVRIISDLNGLDISKPTSHEITIDVDGRELQSILEVVDTTAPTGESVNLTIWDDETVTAEEFVKNVKDVSQVRVEFVQAPDFKQIGEHDVKIRLIDESGNEGYVTSKLVVKKDTIPPEFSGLADKVVYIGDAVAYKKGVKVWDNKDPKVTFNVNSSEVNLYKEGIYNVYYTAQDSSGNKTTKTTTVQVIPLLVTDEMLDEVAEKILDKILKKNMTKREQAFAIYTYTKKHIAYTGDSDKTDKKAEAYRGYKNAIGDCFTYYALSELLLNYVGIENVPVTRLGGETRHYWSLINCGDGWYHFDSCPNRDKKETFMLTDAEVDALTKSRGKKYYVYDRSKYPATPEK